MAFASHALFDSLRCAAPPVPFGGHNRVVRGAQGLLMLAFGGICESDVAVPLCRVDFSFMVG